MDKLTLIQAMGFEILHVTKKNTNGPDIVAKKSGRAYSFEVKKVSIKKSKSVQCPPVEPNRINDDFIIIEFNSGYVLIEPMSDHLKNCSPSGVRTFGGLY